jgi:hypothetical protein
MTTITGDGRPELAWRCTARDERKGRKLAELAYHLVEFRHDEQFTEETVLERLRLFLT